MSIETVLNFRDQEMMHKAVRLEHVRNCQNQISNDSSPQKDSRNLHF